MTNQTINREQWLTSAAELITAELFTQHTDIAKPAYRVSYGWPMGSTNGKHRTVLGQCFPRSWSAAQVNEIFITPKIDGSDTKTVLLTLIHELCHAYDDCQSGHKGNFAHLAKALGFLPPLTKLENYSTELVEYVEEIADILGPLPHDALNTTKQKKQSSRQLKVYCTNDGCTFKFRASQAMIDSMNYRTCLCCGTETLTQEIK